MKKSKRNERRDVWLVMELYGFFVEAQHSEINIVVEF